jgi:hypothetical protein
MPPPDDLFAAFLGHMPKRFCVECLTAIYGTTNTEGTVTRLRELGAAIETGDAECSNCEQHTTTYRMRRTS